MGLAAPAGARRLLSARACADDGKRILKTVALLLFPGVQSLEVSGPMDVFAEANAFLPVELHYRMVAIGTVPSPIRASNGQQPVADLTPHDAGTDYDIVLVAGGPELSQQAEDPQLSSSIAKVLATRASRTARS
jgi:transcriptional regulator GlxA family with amidase domain